jgi:hypothetical protein
MLRPANVATPATAFCVNVPDRVPPFGFVPIATVTATVDPVTTFPPASSILTWTDGVIGAPAFVAVGCSVNASCDAAPAMILNAVLVGDVRAPEVAFNV